MKGLEILERSNRATKDIVEKLKHNADISEWMFNRGQPTVISSFISSSINFDVAEVADSLTDEQVRQLALDRYIETIENILQELKDARTD